MQIIPQLELNEKGVCLLSRGKNFSKLSQNVKK